MTVPKIAPYGTWASPITSELIVGQAIGLSGLSVDGDDIYWLESRPTEGGRSVLVRRRGDGAEEEVTPPPFNVRSRVHEYGGTAFIVRDGAVVFSNFADGRLYRVAGGADPEPITPETALRYADFDVDRARGLVLCVREDHRDTGEPVNAIVAVNLDGDDDGGRVLIAGSDFYAAPRLSPEGGWLAWLSWQHPNMPWDGTELWLAAIDDDGALGEPRLVAGGEAESIFQPEWSPDGALHFVSDATGWWNLCRWRGSTIEALCPRHADFGQPLWALGMQSYRIFDDGRIACSYVENGVEHLAMLQDGALVEIETPFVETSVPRQYGAKLALAGASASEPGMLALLDSETRVCEVLKRSASFDLDPGYVSVAEAIEFPTTDDDTAHAFFYPPANKDFSAPRGERPPLIVRSHGGPTGASGRALSLAIQYWTSRGFAVVDVNYRGSTGFGRAYRAKLDGAWGVVDVDDCVHAAQFLVDRGRVDGERLAIRGGSAGGYTTLSALAFRDIFKAGASHYGIGDLMTLARDTHKFESRYLDRLIGRLPQAEPLYRERSPILHTDGLNCPVIFFQGLDDKVVPPNQAEAMVAALKEKQLPVAYIAFEGEGHGFRRAENIKRALEAELYFYGHVFGFTPDDDIEPVDI